MHQHSSSTSSSEPDKKPRRLVTLLLLGFWFLLTLIIFDVGVNLFFPYPSGPVQTPPPALNTYFDYGRSVEGQFLQALGKTDDSSSPLMKAAWLADFPVPGAPTKPEPGHKLLALYGMSFTEHLAKALKAIDPTLDMRLVLGPSAPANFVYAAYQRDRGLHEADMVVFSILGSSVLGLEAMSGATMYDDRSAPFTFPRYELVDDSLQETMPLVLSQSELRQTLATPEKRTRWLDQLQAHDRFYDPFLYQHNFSDNSALVRLARRAWSKARHEMISSQIHTSKGFKQDWPGIKVLQTMVVDFAKKAKADGKVPLVVIFENQGYNNHVDQILVPTLIQNQIPYFSTASVTPATDATNFQPDGHFSLAADRTIAQAILPLIHRELDSREHTP